MASRWSNPSGELGARRFRVWPEATDQYNHIDLATNWDTIDAIIGIPADGTNWPPTTGLGGGLWAAVENLRETILPIGMMISWWRPSEAVPVPATFEICDGRSVTEANHDFGPIGSVTLPDMRNRFALGADANQTIGTAGVAATHVNVNNADGAPGPQGTGGSNTHTLTLAQMPAHSHSLGSKTGWSPLGLHWYTSDGMQQTEGGDVDFIPQGRFGSTGTGDGGWMFGQHRHRLDSLALVGSSQTHENRPAYVGLLWIMKVKNG